MTIKVNDEVAFKEVVKILVKNKINYWICHGTLLGIIRDNRLLPWDHDIDFAVWDDEYSKEEIIKIFTEDQRFKKMPVMEEINSLHFLFSSKRIDINFYTRKENKAYINWLAPPDNFFQKLYCFSLDLIANNTSISKSIESTNGSFIKFIKLILAITLFSLRFVLTKKFKLKLLTILHKNLRLTGYSYPMNLMENKLIKFLNIDICAPINSEKILELTYGIDWKIPKKEYVWYREAKNLH